MLVVGAGLAGLMAAATASAGARVALVEKSPLPGRKFLMASMGRGAVSNHALDVDHFLGREGRFVTDALAEFGPAALSDWFAAHGLPLAQAAHYGLVAPEAGPDAVLGALVEALGDADLHLDTRVVKLRRQDGGFAAKLDDGHEMFARRLVLATGCDNLPQLGGENSGLQFAQKLGHAVTPPRPVHVPLSHAENWLHRLVGLWMDVTLTARLGRQELATSTGSLLFTQSGITGEAVFNLTSAAPPGTRWPGIQLELNFFPELAQADVAEWMHRALGGRTEVAAGEALDVMIPRRLGEWLLQRQNVKHNARARDIEQRHRAGLLHEMTALKLEVTGDLGMRAAEAAAGGVQLRQVNPRTMESRLVPGLFFAGQILDVLAPWGGFLQHFSLASGRLAGLHAMRGLDSERAEG